MNFDAIEFTQARNGYSLRVTWEHEDDVAEVELPGGGAAEIWQGAASSERSLRFWPPQAGLGTSSVMSLSDLLLTMQQAIVSLRRPDPLSVVQTATLASAWMEGTEPSVDIRTPEGPIANVSLDPEGGAQVSLVSKEPGTGGTQLVASDLMLALWEASVALDTMSSFRNLEQLADEFPLSD